MLMNYQEIEINVYGWDTCFSIMVGLGKKLNLASKNASLDYKETLAK
jgi:hypothetical protein